ncbi:MAG: YgjV family protein [Clostridia bacterium]|nr:YgjV family protein [Clostridia bacterium]
MNIIIQIIGGFGILASIISFQCKKHNKILLFRTLNELIFAIQYFLLGAYTGMAMNLVGCVRNIIFTKKIEKNKKTNIYIIIFSILFIAFGIFTWQGKKSILIITAKTLSTIAYGNKNTTITRSLILITSTSWLIYNVCVFSVAGVLCEVFTLVSLVAGIIRIDVVPYVKNNIIKKI